MVGCEGNSNLQSEKRELDQDNVAAAKRLAAVEAAQPSDLLNLKKCNSCIFTFKASSLILF